MTPAPTTELLTAAWQPRVPLAETAQHSRDNAVKLQRALARALAAVRHQSISAVVKLYALDDYRREFGHAIGERMARALVTRTLRRDAGAQNWNRLELYLSDNAARKSAPRPVISLAAESEFHALHDVIASFNNPACPSSAEKSCLWLVAFETYEEKLAAGKAPRKTKRHLLAFLQRNAPFLLSSETSNPANSLRVNFQRKYDRWTASDRDAKSLADARAENSGRFRAPDLSAEDRDRLVSHAVTNCGGRSAQAWRELVDRHELSPEITGYYLANPSRKSYVPPAVLESVKHEVASLYDIHHGPRQAQLNGPHISRTWSYVHSLDMFQADDFTFPIYYRAPDGNGGWSYMRGQVLLMIDLRSTRILGFLLLSERNYTARAIRSLITRTCDQYGLPRKGFYFENGIWKKSKIITGAKNAPPLSWAETEMGLREFGLKFIHARLPRTKPIERVGGQLQNLMEGLPGYVGRNEMVEKFERVQKLKRDAERGDPAAAAQFMDEDQWTEQLEKLCASYNQSPQNGKMTEGRSPEETFYQCQDLADPPVKFSPACRYLLANHKRPVRVGPKGILLEGGYYYGAGIAERRGQTLLAWIDPETPEFITVTDMDRKNAVTVPRAKDVPAIGATAQQLADAHRQIAEFTGHTKARYRILKSSRPIVFRDMLAGSETVELGAEISAQREAQNENARRESRGRKLANHLRMALPAEKLQRPGVAESLARLQQLLADDGEPTEKTS